MEETNDKGKYFAYLELSKPIVLDNTEYNILNIYDITAQTLKTVMGVGSVLEMTVSYIANHCILSNSLEETKITKENINLHFMRRDIIQVVDAIATRLEQVHNGGSGVWNEDSLTYTLSSPVKFGEIEVSKIKFNDVTIGDVITEPESDSDWAALVSFILRYGKIENVPMCQSFIDRLSVSDLGRINTQAKDFFINPSASWKPI